MKFQMTTQKRVQRYWPCQIRAQVRNHFSLSGFDIKLNLAGENLCLNSFRGGTLMFHVSGRKAPVYILHSFELLNISQMRFQSVLEQRSHFKLDLHRYNTKQALKGKPALSEEEWERVVERLEENEEEEISGSEDEDSDGEEEGVIKLEGEPRLLLESGDMVLAIHRCLVANMRDVPVDQV